jgi:hypothetical protein
MRALEILLVDDNPADESHSSAIITMCDSTLLMSTQTQVPLQGAEDAYLKDSRFFDRHGSRVALSEPQLTMVAGCF